jgi:hypothetical protein
MAKVFRWFVGHWNGRVVCTFNDNGISHQSVVMVSASEGDAADSSQSPRRFIGDANVSVHNIAPFDGGVTFVITVDWNEPLPVWADIVVFDQFPQGFSRSK